MYVRMFILDIEETHCCLVVLVMGMLLMHMHRYVRRYTSYKSVACTYGIIDGWTKQFVYIHN